MKVGTKYSSMFIHTVKPLYTGFSLYRHPPYNSTACGPKSTYSNTNKPLWMGIPYIPNILSRGCSTVHVILYTIYSSVVLCLKFKWWWVLTLHLHNHVRETTCIWSMFQMDEHNQFKNILWMMTHWSYGLSHFLTIIQTQTL